MLEGERHQPRNTCNIRTPHQQEEAAKPGLGQPVTGQEQAAPPVSASVEPKPRQLWPKPGEDGATPIGPSSSSPDLDKAFKAQVDRVEASLSSRTQKDCEDP